MLCTCRKLAGLTVYRSKLTLQKKRNMYMRHDNRDKVSAYNTMYDVLTHKIIADRSTVVNEPSTQETEFYQNQSFALKHVTNDFFMFFKKLSDVLFSSLRTNKYSSTVIKQAKTCLEDDESLKTHFCELCPLSESEEKVMKGKHVASLFM